MAKSSKNPVQEVQEVQQVVNKVEEPLTQTEVANSEDEKIAQRQTHFNELVTRLEKTQSELKTIKADLAKYNKFVEKEILKASKGRRRLNRERSPTGFSKAGVVPEGLRILLGIAEDKLMTRPEVTNMLYKYLDEHNLRDEEDKRIMRTNTALSKAFGLTTEQVKSINSYKKNEAGKVEKKKGLNFYNIQKYVASLYKGKPITFDLSDEDSEESEKTENEKEVEHVVQPKTKGRGKSKVNVV